MTLSIGGSLSEGASRLFSRAGAILLAVYAATLVVYQLSINGLFAALFRQYLPAEATESAGSVGVTYPAPTAVYGVVTLVCLVVMSAFTVVAVRTFVAGARDRIPREFYTRSLPWAVANLFVGGLAFVLIVLVGTVLLVIPGIVAYVGLIFTTMYVAVEDENFVAALVHSWGLVRSEFLRTFALLLVLVVAMGLFGVALGFTLSLGTAMAGLQGWSGVVTGVLTAPLSLFVLAVLSAAFESLRSDRATAA